MKNPKILSLIFVLVIFSFVNSELNHLAKNTDQLAQTGPGVIEIWHRLFKKTPSDPLRPILDETAQKIKQSPYGYSYTNRKLANVISGKDLKYEKIHVKDGNFIIYFPSYSYDYIYHDIGDYLKESISDIYKKCLEDLECESQINFDDTKFVVLTANSKDYKLIIGKEYAGCFIPRTNTIVINLEKKGFILTARDALPHELTHLILDNLLGTSNMSPGFNEGMACNAESITWFFSPLSLSSKNLLMDKSYPSNYTKPFFYEESSDLIIFLIRKLGSKAAVIQFEKELISSKNSNNVLQKYGFKDFSDLDKQWYQWNKEKLKGGLPKIENVPILKIDRNTQ